MSKIKTPEFGLCLPFFETFSSTPRFKGVNWALPRSARPFQEPTRKPSKRLPQHPGIGRTIHASGWARGVESPRKRTNDNSPAIYRWERESHRENHNHCYPCLRTLVTHVSGLNNMARLWRLITTFEQSRRNQFLNGSFWRTGRTHARAPVFENIGRRVGI
jgi:hypothetical protein